MGFCGEYGLNISEEEKIRENRTDERKKREGVDRDERGGERGEGKQLDNSRFDQIVPTPDPRHPDQHPRHPAPFGSDHRCFLALALTRPSNTALTIVLCAVWNGFSIVYTTSVSGRWCTHRLAYLRVELPNVHKERPDSLVVLALMEQHELHVLS